MQVVGFFNGSQRMSEINRALGNAGVGHTITIKTDKEKKLLNEKEELDTKKVESPDDFTDADQTKLGQINDQLAEEEKLPHLKLTFMPITDARKAEYDEYLESRARKTARLTASELRAEARRVRKEATKPGLTDEERQELSSEAFTLDKDAGNHYQLTDQDITSGAYSFGSKNSVKSLNELPGSSYLAWICLRSKQPDLTHSVVKAIYADNWADMTDALRAVNEMGKLQYQPIPTETPPLSP
jgi:hypothetical protein